MHVLGHLSVEEFLREYWQKKPLLIRNAWPDFKPLLSSDELAGLSLEEEIESRIVQEEGEDGPWKTRTGPFTEDDYQSLPDDKWTLLVQAVDHWIPEAADLLQHFRFIPSWRIDDLMISYAVNGGSVGPHYDQYDVFLLQAEGQREWRIGQMCSENSPILKGPKIRILEQFDETERWLLNPGDMLYLPPQLAHYGIAQGECMTYSIGFRAPSLNELAQSTLDEIMSSASDDQRYSDTDLCQQHEPGLIDQNAAQRLRTLLNEILDDDERLKSIIGRLMTEAKYPEQTPGPEPISDDESIESIISEGPFWRRSEFARFAYSEDVAHTTFFAQGESWLLPAECTGLIAWLANNRQYDSESLIAGCQHPDAQQLIKTLLERQLIYNQEDEYGD